MRRALCCAAIAALVAAGCSLSRHETSPYAGVWVLRYHGRNLLSVSIHPDGQSLRGDRLSPRTFEYDGDGDFTRISIEKRTEPLLDLVQRANELEFSIGSGPDAERYSMRLTDADHAEVRFLVGSAAPPWRLERVARPDDAKLAVDWPEPPATPDVVAVRAELTRMAGEDQSVRQQPDKAALAKMAAADRDHRVGILRIVDRYGWPKTSVFGKEAAHDFWLLVQHQPLDLQQKLTPLMEGAVAAGEASRRDYAMLHDRVMSGMGRPQRWGMNVTCVDGKAEIGPVEDPDHLEERRRELNFPPVAEYVKQIEPFCQATK